MLAMACLPGTAPRAGEVPDLYEAEVPVSDQEAAERERALGLALREVLSKVSGRREVGSNPVLAAAQGTPGRFVQQYRYRVAAAAEASSPAREELRLWARFDADLVDGLVRDAGLPVWGRSRPALLVWLSIDTGGRREWVAADHDAGHLESMRESAARRGIPVVAPLLDLEDRAAVNASEIWAGFFDPLRAASARYGSEALLVGRLRRPGASPWEARWTLLVEEVEEHWTTRAEVPELLLEGGVHGAADLLAARYASLADQQATGRIDLVVTGVRTLEDYARALRYLGGLDEVERVEVDAVGAGQVRFRVEARGGRSAIRQIIAFGATLSPEGYADQGGALQMRLLP